jgi:hypothetical protein
LAGCYNLFVRQKTCVDSVPRGNTCRSGRHRTFLI